MNIKSLIFTKEYLYFKDSEPDEMQQQIKTCTDEMLENIKKYAKQKYAALEADLADDNRYKENCYRVKRIKYKDKETGEKKIETEIINKFGFNSESTDIDYKIDDVEQQIIGLAELLNNLETRRITKKDAALLKSVLYSYRLKEKAALVFGIAFAALLVAVTLIFKNI